MLYDKIDIKVAGGDGGKGGVFFDELRRANGGDGGDGGNVLLVASSHEMDFLKLKNKPIFKAGSGKPGGKSGRSGKDGADRQVIVPEGTHVYRNGELISKLINNGDKQIVARGGRGGRGNGQFRSGQFLTKEKHTPGEPGEDHEIHLELQLRSDAIFVGYPNAGKSSLLNELTNSQVKVAHYAFTTLDPQYGDCDGMRLLDLPGLIEGTHSGKGLGTRFLKHTVHTRLLVHFVASDAADPMTNYLNMRKELAALSKELSAMPELVVLTKIDELKPPELNKISRKLTQYLGYQPVQTSILLEETVVSLKKVLKSRLK